MPPTEVAELALSGFPRLPEYREILDFANAAVSVIWELRQEQECS
jgi:hypothetical protein